MDLIPVLVGLAAGLGIAILSSRVLSTFLFQTDRFDMPTFLAGPGILLVVAAAACLLPTRRALGIDPVRALRSE